MPAPSRRRERTGMRANASHTRMRRHPWQSRYGRRRPHGKARWLAAPGRYGWAAARRGELPVTWASRTERADGKTSPEELAAAAHSACYAMALALRLGEHKAVPERLAITATVTLDEVGGVPTIVSSHLDVTARVPGLDQAGFDTVVGEASELCPVSRLFAGAKITVDAALEPAA